MPRPNPTEAPDAPLPEPDAPMPEPEAPLPEPDPVGDAAVAGPDQPGAAADPAPDAGPQTGEALPETNADPDADPGAVPDPDPALPVPDAATPPPARPAIPAALPADGPEDDDDPDLRLPAVLKGVWAPSLAACIAYTDGLEAPQTLDAALPRMNPLDGPRLGTVLLTSRRMLLFNAVGTECAVTALAGGADDVPLTADLACAAAVAPELSTPMRITRLAADGPAPRIAVSYGEAEPIELIQCRPLGRLGSDFAPLWTLDAAACRATAPVAGAAFAFHPGANGALALTLRPETAPDDPGAAGLRVSVDGIDFATGETVWADGAWSVSLGAFGPASARLSRGLLLDARAADGSGPRAPTLPLLGSGRAMEMLAGCAVTGE